MGLRYAHGSPLVSGGNRGGGVLAAEPTQQHGQEGIDFQTHDGKISVKEYLSQTDKELTVTDFKRFSLN
jgi:hypothetical protein